MKTLSFNIIIFLFGSIAYVGVDGANVFDTVKFKLYTRQNRDGKNISYSLFQFFENSNFDGLRLTKIIIHGFLYNSESSWVIKMKDEILKKDNVNVVTVDWSKSFELSNYNQAVQNIRKVGDITGMWLRHEFPTESNMDKVHFIGHCLGAHIAGYVGTTVESQMIGRITALDPAKTQSGCLTAPHVINKGDASFVDAIHTDAGPSGYGMMDRVGNVDYYPNGGIKQPGCEDNVVVEGLKNTGIGKNNAACRGTKCRRISCNHSRAYQLFTDSINAQCQYKSQFCQHYALLLQGRCFPENIYGVMGYNLERTLPYGKHYLVTNAQAPFCKHEAMVDNNHVSE